ncbi:MAG: transglycosylase SLT domain-containing protein [Chitinivibrionales bacterium]|nr:transglycosylase SLT domain-containing protein [Chitinivibrionales bacterium]
MESHISEETGRAAKPAASNRAARSSARHFFIQVGFAMASRRYLHFGGILVHGSKMWISEFTSIALLILLCSAVTGAIVIILLNVQAIRFNTDRIARLKTEQVLLQRSIDRQQDKTRIGLAVLAAARGQVPPQTLAHLIELVYANSKQYGYDPLLLLAVIQVESVFDPRARGRFRDGEFSGALGLMQLKYATAREVAADLDIELQNRNDLFKPEINVVLGVAYLTRLIKQFQDLKLGILAYNQGPGTIRKTMRENRPLSIRYYNKVLRSYYAMRRIVDGGLRATS